MFEGIFHHSRCHCRWSVLLLSSHKGRYQQRSLLAWSSGQSITLPLFRPIDGLTTDYRTPSSVGRCYTVQPLKDNRASETEPKQVPPANKSDELCRAAVSSKLSDASVDGTCDTVSSDIAATVADSKQQDSDTTDGADGIQQTEVETSENVENDAVQHVGLMQRFRMMYKQYGVVLVCVHAATASVWVSLFYFATVSGVDIVPLLRWLGASDKIVSPFLVPGVGKAAVIYLMYKLATPARYTVTIAGTQLAVRFLRRRGYLKVPEAPSGKPDTLRSIVSDGRAKAKDKVQDLRDDMKGKFGQIRGELNNEHSSSRQGKL